MPASDLREDPRVRARTRGPNQPVMPCPAPGRRARSRGAAPRRPSRRATSPSPSIAVSGMPRATRTQPSGTRGVDRRGEDRLAAALADASRARPRRGPAAANVAALKRAAGEDLRVGGLLQRRASGARPGRPRRSANSAMRSSSPPGFAPRRAGGVEARCPGPPAPTPAGRARCLARTASSVSASKPGRPSSAPSMRSTFHAGRDSPSGFTTALNDCTRPSMFTKVPPVSVNGRDRQHHVRVVHDAVAIGRERHDELRAGDGRGWRPARSRAPASRPASR